MKVREAAARIDRMFGVESSRDDWREVVAASPSFYGSLDAGFRDGKSGLMLVHGGEAPRFVTAFHPSRGVTDRIERADLRDALLVVHHPLAWEGALGRFLAPDRQVLDRLRARRVSIHVVHDRLDRVGPRSTVSAFAGVVGLAEPEPFDLLWMGEPFEAGLVGSVPEARFADLVERLAAHYGMPPVARMRHEGAGRVACIPGRALLSDAVDAAVSAGAATLVTGWVDDRTLARADLPVNLIAVGHYYSEVSALASLAALLDEEGLEARFIDDPFAREDALRELARKPAKEGPSRPSLW